MGDWDSGRKMDGGIEKHKHNNLQYYNDVVEIKLKFFFPEGNSLLFV